jgi:hypothetical protein
VVGGFDGQEGALSHPLAAFPKQIHLRNNARPTVMPRESPLLVNPSLLLHCSLLAGAEYHCQPIDTLDLKCIFALWLNPAQTQHKYRARASRGNFFPEADNWPRSPVQSF